MIHALSPSPHTHLMSRLNSHFVSRFLTYPWEFGERQLWYYDFDSDRIHQRSSRNLFARVGGTTHATERTLNKYVESPIAASLQRLANLGADHAELLEWPLVRALTLLILFQPLRSSSAAGDGATFEQISGWDESRLDAAASRFSDSHALVRLRAHAGAPLHYPASGLFTMPVQADDGSWHRVLAIPLTPQFAVAVVPRVAQRLLHAIRHLTGGFLGNCSVGTSSTHVVVHPDYVEANARTDITTALRHSRTQTVELLGLCEAYNARLQAAARLAR